VSGLSRVPFPPLNIKAFMSSMIKEKQVKFK
jgi:hypothetical protein